MLMNYVNIDSRYIQNHFRGFDLLQMVCFKTSFTYTKDTEIEVSGFKSNSYEGNISYFSKIIFLFKFNKPAYAKEPANFL